jgi:hypothetical protein
MRENLTPLIKGEIHRIVRFTNLGDSLLLNTWVPYSNQLKVNRKCNNNNRRAECKTDGTKEKDHHITQTKQGTQNP